MVGIEGTAQGRMKITLSQRIHGRAAAKKPDSNSARNSLRLMPMPRNTTVLTSVRRKMRVGDERRGSSRARAQPEPVEHRPEDEEEEEDHVGDDQRAIRTSRADVGRASATFAMYASTGSTFSPHTQWKIRDGGWGDPIRWLPGDFNGDGLADVLAVWNDAGRTR